MNKDTIYRQAAIDALEWKWAGKAAIDAIKNLPSAQPEIIYCKDCKYYIPMNRKTQTGICNLTMHQNFGDDWFCAGAERRTDEQAD